MRVTLIIVLSKISTVVIALKKEWQNEQSGL